MLSYLRSAVLLTMALPFAAHASVTVLLEQPYGKLDIFNPAGHAAIYLDHVCADSPTRLRPCAPGELGVVIGRYDRIAGRDWLAVPLLPYLYAVTTPDEVPDTMDRVREGQLRDAYRRAHLEDLVPDGADGTAPAGNWYELVGAAYDRTIYGFRVPTTPQQDGALIAMFNDRRNVQRYNGMYRNCADFARVTVNRVYPHAVRRNYVADVGITSPKSVARGLAHYAKKHPEVPMDVFVVPQVKGSLPRSHSNTCVSEGVLKRYSVPLSVLAPELEIYAVVAYIAHGRFPMPKNAPALDLLQPESQLAITRPFPSPLPQLPEPHPPVVTQRTLAELVAAGRDR